MTEPLWMTAAAAATGGSTAPRVRTAEELAGKAAFVASGLPAVQGPAVTGVSAPSATATPPAAGTGAASVFPSTEGIPPLALWGAVALAVYFLVLKK